MPVENVTQLPLDKVTLGDAMKKAGYATALFGKWHLGQQGKHHPAARGFDEAITSMGKHFDFATQPKVDYPKGTYLADWLTDKALAFIEKNKDRPFFLCLHHFGVHAPHEAKPELIERFKKKPGVGGHNDPTYAAMIYSVDESVGRVLAKLDELKLAENTLVIFTSDNGGVGGYVEAGVKAKEGITNNAPLRGGKGMLYEGGVRVPWIARWPGKVKAGLDLRRADHQRGPVPDAARPRRGEAEAAGRCSTARASRRCCSATAAERRGRRATRCTGTSPATSVRARTGGGRRPPGRSAPATGS